MQHYNRLHNVTKHINNIAKPKKHNVQSLLKTHVNSAKPDKIKLTLNLKTEWLTDFY